MDCLYCRYRNEEDDHRCRRCGRRLKISPARPGPETYPIAKGALATAMQPAMAPLAKTAPVADPPLKAAARVEARQQSFPWEGDPTKVIEFPRPVTPRASSRPRSQRPAAPPRDNQPLLDFLPAAPHTPRTLNTSVEAVIFCDAPVATSVHRLLACALDTALVVIAYSVFLAAFTICGGEFHLSAATLPWFAGALVPIGLFYASLFTLTGTETFGARWTGLKLINFDGFPITRRERLLRSASACLSILSGGLGLLWSLADEESLTWHDHISKTFPTIRD